MTDRITREEIEGIFGEAIPMEAVIFLFDPETEKLPLSEVREKLQHYALIDRKAHEKAELAAQLPMHCSFCSKSQHEVKKLIAGPMVFICDECVYLSMVCLEIDHIPSGYKEPLVPVQLIEDVYKYLNSARFPHAAPGGQARAGLRDQIRRWINEHGRLQTTISARRDQAEAARSAESSEPGS